MKYNEIKGDLFESDIKFKVHCISSDLAMRMGIAVQFVNKYPNIRYKIRKLNSSSINIGDCIVVKYNDDYIANLITKSKYYHKPTIQDLIKSLYKLKEYIISNNITDIAMPKIGSGLDKLNWNIVSRQIILIFQNIDINIHVYYL